MSVARRVARVLGRDGAPLVTTMTGVRRDPVAGPRRRLGELLHLLERVDLCAFFVTSRTSTLRRETQKTPSRCADEGESDAGAPTLDDVREAVTTLEDTTRIARRVLGGAHPTTGWMENELRKARAVLRAHETPSPGEAT